MTKYREIIRLTSLGFSQRNIMASCGVAQKTVVKVQKRARELNLVWPLEETMTDIELIMGHADISTTMDIYAEATERKKQESFELLAAKLDSIF